MKIKDLKDQEHREMTKVLTDAQKQELTKQLGLDTPKTETPKVEEKKSEEKKD